MELRMMRVLMGESAVDVVIDAPEFVSITAAWVEKKNNPEVFSPLAFTGYSQTGMEVPTCLDAWLVTGFILMGPPQGQASDRPTLVRPS